MDKINFSLSLLNGRLKAASFRRGTVAATWEGPELREDFTGLAPALSEAARQTKAGGKGIAMALALPRLSEQIIEVPPVKGRDLARFLQRQVQNVKAFPGEAVWSSQPALPTKKAKAALVHVLPKAVLDQLLRSSQQAGLQLVRLAPTSAILMKQLKSLPLQKDELALLVAETEGSTTVVIGRKDGQVCLSRVLPNTWNGAPDKVWVDLTRSIAFAEQQSGLTVSSVWLFGPGAEAQLEAVKPIVKLPVTLSPVAYSPFYWAEQAAKLSDKEDGNLVSDDIRQAPQRKRMLTFTALLVFVLFVFAQVTAGVIEWVRRGQLESIAAMNARITSLGREKSELERAYAEIEQMDAVARLVNEERLPLAPQWFLAYLGQVLPDELMVNRLQVSRTNDLWAVKMAGVSKPNLDLARTGALQVAFSTLSSNLSSGPFHLAITHSELGKTEPASASRAAGHGLLAQFNELQERAQESHAKAAHPFVLEGIMQ